ncbi:MAG: hypothetical protein ACKVQU_23420 [Burkholderiales bacterium]
MSHGFRHHQRDAAVAFYRRGNRGLGLARAPLISQQVDEVHEALMQHLVVFFRNQPIDFVTHKPEHHWMAERS